MLQKKPHLFNRDNDDDARLQKISYVYFLSSLDAVLVQGVQVIVSALGL